jgi:hypothetical protein
MSKPDFFAIIGDVHGHYKDYIQICEKFDYSLQVGDMGFNYISLNNLDPNHHKFIGGNHEAYHTVPASHYSADDPHVNNGLNHFVVKDMVYHMNKFTNHSLGQWGTWQIPGVISKNFSGKIFFVRGAWSIDYMYRTVGRDWFAEEELTQKQANQAIDDYINEKPDFVVSHCCPDEFVPNLQLPYSNGEHVPTLTGAMLQAMFNAHKPKLWVFGHFHQNVTKEVKGTTFVCLNELSVLKFDNELNCGDL